MRSEESSFPSLGRRQKDIWLLRGVALVISILLCLTVMGGKRVEVLKKVPIDYQLKKGLIIANQAPTEITVRVLGPRAFMKGFQDRHTAITVDLTKLQPGDFDIPIKESMVDVPLGIKVLSISQSNLAVRIDYLASKRVPIRAVFAPSLGDSLKVKSVTFKPSTVEIQGSRSRLVSIDVIPTEPINLAPDNFSQEVEVKLSTADFPGIVIRDTDRIVQGVIELEGELARKWFSRIPIGIKIGSGAQAKFLDFAHLGIKIKPEYASFLLEGSVKVVSALKEHDIEAWVELSQVKGGVFRSKLVWRLSPDVRVVKRNTDWVDVVIPPLQ